ncbi:hypothetical protein N473_05420 [Pseudoalteromonas luteoviolacea CPMOR-1]|uniref:Alkaline phosphatase n=1 Tax=Pseudoalteromonas luteoviolacea CPMOR-1 TaxID=1365248 RepID=A0A167HIP3_9GAMM|nr:hypothetical protein N473_05420 [Pseudoalteromonas luteoviolacea CPMOR-1]
MGEHTYKPKFNFGPLEQLDKLYNQTGTFFNVMADVNVNNDFSNSTDHQWQEAIKNNTAYEVSIEETAIMLETKGVDSENRPYPAFSDFSDFYVYGKDDFTGKIGRVLAKHQNVVWGTGTHTAAPVPVYAFGPAGVTQQFSTLQHHVDIANKMMAALGVNE